MFFLVFSVSVYESTIKTVNKVEYFSKGLRLVSLIQVATICWCFCLRWLQILIQDPSTVFAYMDLTAGNNTYVF